MNANLPSASGAVRLIVINSETGASRPDCARRSEHQLHALRPDAGRHVDGAFELGGSDEPERKVDAHAFFALAERHGGRHCAATVVPG